MVQGNKMVYYLIDFDKVIDGESRDNTKHIAAFEHESLEVSVSEMKILLDVAQDRAAKSLDTVSVLN